MCGHGGLDAGEPVEGEHHRLADLIDVARVQRMCQTLSDASGVALAVLDVDGDVLVAAGWQDICTKFHREHPETVRHCLESDLRINQHLMSFNGEPVPYAYRCANGLWDVAHPLIVDGEHLANVFTGQFFFDDEQIDEAAFREQARAMGFDEAAYMEALARVPVVSHARAELMIAVVADLVGMLGELGLGGLRQQRAEAALRESEARYRGLAEDMPIFVTMFSPDGALTFTNREVATMLDSTPDDLMAREMFEFIPAQERDTVRRALAALTPEHPVETHEQTHTSADGAMHWQQWTNRAIYDGDGGVLRYQAVGQDVTDRKRAEQVIADNQRHYETFLNATDDMGFLKDAALRYVLVNAANARYFGLPAADIVGRADSELMTPDAAASCRTTDVAALEQQRLIVSCEEVGGRVYETRKFPVALPDGGVGVGGYVRDITEQRTAEEKIARLNADLELRVAARTAELEAANRELESFSYSVSHDLRAPLRSIDGFSEILVEDYAEQLDEKGRGYLARIRAADQKMALMIDALLALSRVGRGELDRRTVDLSAVAREVAEQLRSNEPERQVEFAIGDGLVAEADPTLVRVVLENLIGNAWRFTGHHATARIEVGADAFPAPGPGTLPERAFYVRDDGAGFSMDNSDRLFGAFQRLHTPGQFEGTGIGLATVQRIVRRHGGRVWADGEVEKGATFWFTLPAAGCRAD